MPLPPKRSKARLATDTFLFSLFPHTLSASSQNGYSNGIPKFDSTGIQDRRKRSVLVLGVCGHGCVLPILEIDILVYLKSFGVYFQNKTAKEAAATSKEDISTFWLCLL